MITIAVAAILLCQSPGSFDGVSNAELVKQRQEIQETNVKLFKEIARLRDLAGEPPGPFSQFRNCTMSRRNMVKAKPRPLDAQIHQLIYQREKGDEARKAIEKELVRRGSSIYTP